VRPKDQKRAVELDAKIAQYESSAGPLPGLKHKGSRVVLIEQIIESVRRIEFAHLVRDDSEIDPRRADPSSDLFDPLRAAVFQLRRGQFDEAFWLIFLSVHFGKHAKDGWRLTRDIYGALGGKPWTWARISADVPGFRAWLTANQTRLRSDGVSRRFSNHRKYESLIGSSSTGTGAAVESYVKWVAPPRTHQQLVQGAHKEVGQNPKEVFDYLYRSMNAVNRFGRLAKFDYLTMLGKLGIAPIEPGSAYLSGATGPLRGARLLFGGSEIAKLKSKELETRLIELDLGLGVGMQVLEDSLCNWQKSPTKFISFRG
jgi:hypothetical protein